MAFVRILLERCVSRRFVVLCQVFYVKVAFFLCLLNFGCSSFIVLLRQAFMKSSELSSDFVVNFVEGLSE